MAVWLYLSGDVKKAGTERFFLTVTFLVASLFLIVLSAAHLALGLNSAPVVIAGIAALIMTGFYLLVRFRKCLFYPKLILTIGVLVGIDLVWYYKYLSNGPVLFYMFIFAALVNWVWHGRALRLLLLLYFLNLLFLFYVESLVPDSLFTYPGDGVRRLDIYLSLALYSGFMIFFLYLVKKDFLRQKAQVVQSDKLKTAFLENMSHEVRTPMNAIVGFSQLLSKDSGEEETQTYVDIIQSSGHSLMRLIDDVLDLSRIEAGDMTLSYTRFSLNMVFAELKEFYLLDLKRQEKADVSLSFSLPKNDLMVYSDLVRVKQVLGNLLNNAVKFTCKGSITYSCEPKRGYLLFTIADTGTGIPKDDQATIYQRFTRFNYLGMNSEGTGIGLSIAEKIISAMGGRIWLESVFGQGTVFYFTIPQQ